MGKRNQKKPKKENKSNAVNTVFIAAWVECDNDFIRDDGYSLHRSSGERATFINGEMDKKWLSVSSLFEITNADLYKKVINNKGTLFTDNEIW